jgi:GH25 family lysozyme M1 (1,4-beta-N-acetylmuramidase)
MKKTILIGFLLSSILYASGEHTGNHMHEGNMTNHMTAYGQIALLEAGNDAFGTIQEVIKNLNDDPQTDWSKVNIEALRVHLVDMQDMTMNIEVVAQKNISNGVEVTIKPTTSRANEALTRVLKAHPAQMKKEIDWDMKVKTEGQKFIIITTTSKKNEVDKIRGLGYIGLMAYGTHHQPHHWMMATGKNPH